MFIKMTFYCLFCVILLTSCKDHEKAEKFRHESFEKSNIKDYSSAIELGEKALSYEENNSTNMSFWDSAAINDAYIAWADEKYKNKDYKEAYNLYTAVISHDKYYGAAYISRSHCSEEMQNLPGALTDAENYIVCINHFMSADNLNYLYSNLSQNNLSVGWIRHADVNYKLGRFENALEDFGKAADHSSKDSVKADIYTVMAKIAIEKIKDAKGVIQYADKAIQYDSTRSQPFIYKAIAYKSSQMKNAACFNIRKAISLGANISKSDIDYFCN